MDYDTITYELSDGVAVITLNRPDVMNAFTADMRAELAHAITEAGRAARVVVLTGAGRAFCAGQDLGASGGKASNFDLERMLRDEYMPILRAIRECRVPVMAAVNGGAAGAGANFALSADVVIAKESAYFMQAFSKVGLMPDAGGTYLLPRLIGPARAMGAALFGDKISAKQAEDWGLIWEAVPDDAFEATWKARAKTLAEGPTQAYGNIKEALQVSLENDYDTQLSLESRLQGKCGKTRDFQEGLVAFLDKRPPSYEGR